ncbi:hypothetical protein J1614_007870 [Plenodomus biglobosus]|nr:hypothetical protein J1614_007870 [Plenodomus biglobosus]
MAPLRTLTSLVLANLATARQCSNFLIPVDISSRQGQFKQISTESNLDVGAFVTKLNEYQKNYTATLLEGYQTFSGSFQISAQYCCPDSGSSGTIQVLTHGIGFDKTYWDLGYGNYAYSYVDTALKAGYSTLAIDRFGIGNSSHGDPLNDIQAQAEVEALHAVTLKLRRGEIDQIGCAYSKVVHVGHSFGSVQSYWLSALYPDSTDGVILTGYSGAGSFLPYIVAGWNLHSARLNQPLRFGNASNAIVSKLAGQNGLDKDLATSIQKLLVHAGVHLSSQEVWDIVTSTEVLDLIVGYNTSVILYDYPSGYMASSDLTALQYAFLYPNMYEEGLAIQSEQTKQPVTTGELLTIGSAPKSSPFTGPVLVITGEYDVPFCGGNCYAQAPGTNASNIPEGVAKSFPSASKFEAYIQPGTGHGLTLQINATAGYEVIQNFLASNGLAAR